MSCPAVLRLTTRTGHRDTKRTPGHRGARGRDAPPRPIRWDVITRNHGITTKYASAIRLRTASTEALLRRFTSETTHPAYAATPEVGRAQRTVLTDADRRGLTPLFHTDMTPYGEIRLRTDRRLDLTDLPTA